MPSDLELALRVRSDMREALQGIGALNRSLRDTSRRGGEAGAALAGATGAARELSATFERGPGRAASGTWIEAMQTSLSALGRESERTLGQTRYAAETAFDAMEAALVRFVTTGRLDFSSFVDSVVADLARLAGRRFFTRPLAELLFGAVGADAAPGSALFGLFGSADVGHAGTVVGRASGVTRIVPAGLFAGAPRFHEGGIVRPRAAGLRADEVPIIAQAGETILPRGTVIAPPAVEINFRNEGTPQREVSREVRLDPRGLVVSIVTDDLRRGGPIRQTMQRELGGGAR